jgi:hypothetical protein
VQIVLPSTIAPASRSDRTIGASSFGRNSRNAHVPIVVRKSFVLILSLIGDRQTVQRTALNTRFPALIGRPRGGQNTLAIQRDESIQRLAAFALFQQRQSIPFDRVRLPRCIAATASTTDISSRLAELVESFMGALFAGPVAPPDTAAAAPNELPAR